MWDVMTYAIGVAAALSVAGYCAELLCIMRKRPRRWAWFATAALSIIWAVVSILWSGPAATTAPEQISSFAEQATVNGTGATDTMRTSIAAASPLTPIAKEAAPTFRWPAPSDATLIATRISTSSLMLLWLLGTGALLRQRMARWQRATVLGREVLVSEFTGPALMGTLRPRIVVPRWFLQESAARQLLILRHEELHIAARDPLLLRLMQIFTMALPWNLPLWWQLGRLRRAIELDCDARVLRSGARIADYGEVLLSVTRRGGHAPAGVLAMGARSSALAHRIDQLAADPRPVSPLRAVVVLLTGIAGMGAAAALEAPSLPSGMFVQPRQPLLLPPTLAATAPAAAAPVIAESPEGSVAHARSAAALPRLLPPPVTRAPVRSRRQILEASIVEHHPELVNGPGRDGQAFVSVELGLDGSVVHSELRYVEAGDVAGVGAAMRHAMQPFQGQLLLARGWQIADGATMTTQTRVSYRMREDPAEIGRQQQASASERATLKRVVEHYLPGAMSDRGTDNRGTPYLLVAHDGRVIESGYFAPGISGVPSFGSLARAASGQSLSAISITSRYPDAGARHPMLVIAWVEPEGATGVGDGTNR